MLSARAVHLNTDGLSYPAKTPARSTRNRNENAYQGAMTVHDVKNKGSITRTPFHPKTTQPKRLLKDTPGSCSTKNPIHLITKQHKPLADKTPFANRVLNIYNTPAPPPKSLKFDCLIPYTNEEHGVTPESASGSARASSTRRHSRVPKPYINLQTPISKGNHWDVSDGDIVMPEMDQITETEDDLDDSDEIEYMAPNTLSLPHGPPFDFDLPDYTLIGQAALRNLYSYPYDDPIPPAFDFHISDRDFMKWDSLSLPPLLSDDKSSSQASKRPNARLATKPSTTVSKLISTTSRGTSALVTKSRATSKSSTKTSARSQIPSVSVKAGTAKPSSTRTSSTPIVPRSSSVVTRTTSAAGLTVSTARKTGIDRAAAAARNTRVEPPTPAGTVSTYGTLHPQQAKPASSAITKTTTSRTAAVRNSFARPVASKRPVVSSKRPQGPTSDPSASSKFDSIKLVPTVAASRDRHTTARKPAVVKSGGPNAKCTLQVKAPLASSVRKSSSTKPSVKSSSTRSVQPGSTKLKLKPGDSIPGPGNKTRKPEEVRDPQVGTLHQTKERTKFTTAELTTRSLSSVDTATGNYVGESVTRGAQPIVSSPEVTGLPKVIETLRVLTMIPEETFVVETDEGPENRCLRQDSDIN